MKSAIITFCYEANMNGDISGAFTRMELKINHRIFRELVQNLEMCSRHNADYETVIRRSLEYIKNYMSQKEERKNMVNQARFNVILVIGVFAACMKLLTYVTGSSIAQLFLGDIIGKALLFICFLSLLYAVWKMISMGKK